MKLSNLLPMPVSSPASSTTLPAMPKALTAALQTAEVLLAGRANLNRLLSEQTTKLPALLRAKVDSENSLAHTRTSELLDEVGDVDVQEAQAALDAATLAYKTTSGVRASLRERLIDPSAEAQLVASKQDIQALAPDYTQQVADAFATEYRIAAEQFSRVLARGKALSAALRVDVPMPAPQAAALEPNGMDLAGLADVTRIGAALDGLNAALSEIVNDRAQVRRERSIRAPFAVGQVWELLRPYGNFPSGIWIESPLLSEATLERLARVPGMVRRVSEGELAASTEHDAALPA